MVELHPLSFPCHREWCLAEGPSSRDRNQCVTVYITDFMGCISTTSTKSKYLLLLALSNIIACSIKKPLDPDTHMHAHMLDMVKQTLSVK